MHMTSTARFVASEIKRALYESGKRYKIYLPTSSMYNMLNDLNEHDWEAAFLALSAEGIKLSYENEADEFVAQVA